MYQNIAVLFAFAFFYSLVAGWLGRTPVAGALVFTAFGLTACPVAEAFGRRRVPSEPESHKRRSSRQGNTTWLLSEEVGISQVSWQKPGRVTCKAWSNEV